MDCGLFFLSHHPSHPPLPTPHPTLHRKHNDWTDWLAAPVMHAHNQRQRRMDLHRGRRVYRKKRKKGKKKTPRLKNVTSFTMRRPWQSPHNPSFVTSDSVRSDLFVFLAFFSSLYLSVCCVALSARGPMGQRGSLLTVSVAKTEKDSYVFCFCFF